MGALGFIRLGVWQNFIRAWRSGYQGNMNGEGFILGGVFVIGPGDQVEQIWWTRWQRRSQLLLSVFIISWNAWLCLQGILLEHHEKEFGNKVDTADVLQAVKKIMQGN